VLSCYRVLDLTDERGDAAGFFLAQLGAEVIAVEPPGGSARRHVGPFAEGVAGPERALGHWAYNRGKASVVVETAEQLEALAAGADVLIECGAMPIDLEALRRANPSLLTVSLSPFGGDGPKAGWQATDLTLDAASGRLAITGDTDRPPVRITAPQVWINAAAETAAAVVCALYERGRSGTGQHLDVSAQEAMILTTQSWTGPALVDWPSVVRVAGGAVLLGCRFRFVYAALDGHITFGILPGSMTGPFVNRLLAVMAEAGECSDELAAEDWVDIVVRHDPSVLAGIVDATCAAVDAFVSRRTTGDLFALSLERHLLVMPLARPSDVLASPQLEARGFWDSVGPAELGLDERTEPVRFAGPFAQVADAPLHRLARPPRLGEHTETLLATAAARRPSTGGPVGGPGPDGDGARRALDGIRVIDLTWVYAGPFATRWLAYEGAQVIRVESTTRPDQVRGAGQPFKRDGGPEDSLQWHNVNADKLSLQLNLAVPEARQVIVDLARTADVLIESFAPGVLRRMGLGPDELHAVNDQLIYVSTALFGQTGPLSRVPGFGNMGAAAGGFYALTGWPDRLPAGPYLAYTDATSPRLTVTALVAALDWRRRSGRGTTIDFSQIEGGVHFLGPAILAAEVNGENLTRLGNRDPHAVPHGIYPAGAPGEDRWVALACRDDRDWRAVCAWMGRDDLAGLDTAARRAREDELDELLASWTTGQDPDTFQREGQARGLAVHQVQNSPEMIADPQLLHRHHYVPVPHSLYGSSWAEQFGIRASRTPGGPRHAGPCWGEHNDEVLRGVLGYDDDQIVALALAGGLE